MSGLPVEIWLHIGCQRYPYTLGKSNTIEYQTANVFFPPNAGSSAEKCKKWQWSENFTETSGMKKLPRKKAVDRKREHLWKTYLFILAVSLFSSVGETDQFSNFVIFWRAVVFLNISQRFDSISGMLSMTLVWNQRTTLENEGGGKKRLSRRSHWCASINKVLEGGGVVTSPQAPPTKSLNADWKLLSEKPVWQYIHSQKYVKGRKYIKGIYIKDSVALYKNTGTVFKWIFLKHYYYYVLLL